MRGPKSLPLVPLNIPYHGPADDDARAIIATTHGDAVATAYLNMGQHFSKDAQSFIISNQNTFPDCIFKRGHSSRTLCIDFATSVDGLKDDYEDKAAAHVTLLEQEIRNMVTLPPIPRNPRPPAPPVPRNVQLDNDDPNDDDTLATTGDGTAASSFTKKRIKSVLQFGKPLWNVTS